MNVVWCVCSSVSSWNLPEWYRLPLVWGGYLQRQRRSGGLHQLSWLEDLASWIRQRRSVYRYVSLYTRVLSILTSGVWEVSRVIVTEGQKCEIWPQFSSLIGCDPPSFPNRARYLKGETSALPVDDWPMSSPNLVHFGPRQSELAWIGKWPHT